MNSLDLTTSRVVTPKMVLGLYTPAFLNISAAMGTVELTGLEMMPIMASGQTLAAAAAMVATMDALVLKRSSLVMPGFLGTPAGMTTISAPTRLASSWSAPTNPVVVALVSMWDRSAATPGVCTMSYRLSLVTAGFSFNSMDRGCPMPPLAPMTATAVLFAELVDSWRPRMASGCWNLENMLESERLVSAVVVRSSLRDHY